MVDTQHDALATWIVAGALLAGLAIFTLLPGINASAPGPVTDVSVRGATAAATDPRAASREGQMWLEGFAVIDAAEQLTETVPDGDDAGLEPAHRPRMEIAS